MYNYASICWIALENPSMPLSSLVCIKIKLGCVPWLFGVKSTLVLSGTPQPPQQINGYTGITTNYSRGLDTSVGTGTCNPEGTGSNPVLAYIFLLIQKSCIISLSVSVHDLLKGQKLLMIWWTFSFLHDVKVILFVKTVSLQFSLSPSLIGVVFLLIGGLYALTQPLWGYLADKKVGTICQYFFIRHFS